ncbi:hypothetical protein P261_02860 [Lachnospiraceae bacterium TWA4]|nr:hypothetical protein P261_02860 [Lachnospiraceae bacterium TWA4]
MKLKKLIAIVLLVMLTMGVSTNVMAATTKDWVVHYYKELPSNVANPVYRLSLPYTKSGFQSKCNSISGSNDRRVEVTALNLGGLEGGKKYITKTGTSAVWKTVEGKKTDVEFKFYGTGTSRCSAMGKIYTK